MRATKFNALKDVFKALHGPRGCLWDKQQTHRSLIPDLREEVEEFIEAVENDDAQHMREELGDILLHVMFNAQLASKRRAFDIEDVIDGLIRKIKRRHPHVFGTLKVNSTQEIIDNWDRIKARERRGRAAAQRRGNHARRKRVRA